MSASWRARRIPRPAMKADAAPISFTPSVPGDRALGFRPVAALGKALQVVPEKPPGPIGLAQPAFADRGLEQRLLGQRRTG